MSELIVSVSGVRGIVGRSLTPDVALEFAAAYGTYLGGGRVVLARDSRVSGEMLECAAAAGLAATGCAVTRLGVAMTPTAAYAIRSGGFAGGIIVTASHNPGEWNGLKLLDEQGLAPDPQRAREVAAIRERRAFGYAADVFPPCQHDPDAGRRHADAVLAAVETDLSRLARLRVVLDCVNGAGGVVSPEFLRRAGCEVTVLNGEPNGRFAHEPEPIEANLGQLCGAVRDAGAAIGFAQDPDADRLVTVDESGRYVGEEYTLALSVWSVLERRRGPVAANLSTSRMIDDLAARFAVPVHRTPVGEAHVARAILAHRCVLGGEGNGGVIDPRISLVRDSLSAISHILQLMASRGKPLGELVAEIRPYVMLKEKLALAPAAAAAALARLSESYQREPARGAALNAADGVRVDTPQGWVHLRASNTEPIVRVIAEAESRDACRRLIDEIRRRAGL